MLHILGKIQIVFGKSTPDIIPVLISALGQFLEFRQNDVIASLPRDGFSQPVVYLFPAV
ncbi:hypothetical protein SDC9_201487 [bioreactor metagenome]|uniref:Uncharacterized protein n=1 Tax=bioreactor metagenome TaxID=1076179 RepID=A0A645IR36_9ZZZZ